MTSHLNQIARVPLRLPLLWSKRNFSTPTNQQSLDELCAHVINVRNFVNLTPQMDKEVHIYSRKKETPVSLKSLFETGKGEKLHQMDALISSSAKKHNVNAKILMQVACFLHREIPIRLAHRASQLEANPIFLQSRKSLLLTVSVSAYTRWLIQHTSNRFAVGTRHLLHSYVLSPFPTILNVKQCSER
jgi:hypothetical protein